MPENKPENISLRDRFNLTLAKERQKFNGDGFSELIKRLTQSIVELQDAGIHTEVKIDTLGKVAGLKDRDRIGAYCEIVIEEKNYAFLFITHNQEPAIAVSKSFLSLDWHTNNEYRDSYIYPLLKDKGYDDFQEHIISVAASTRATKEQLPPLDKKNAPNANFVWKNKKVFEPK